MAVWRRLLVSGVALLALAGVVSPVVAQESEPPDPSELVEVFAAVDDVEASEAGELVVVDVLSNDGDGDDPGAALVVVTAPGSGVAVVGVDEGDDEDHELGPEGEEIDVVDGEEAEIIG